VVPVGPGDPPRFCRTARASTSTEAVLARFSEHFVRVLGGGRDLTDEVWEQLDATVREVDGVLVAEAGGTRAGEEPSLVEV